MTHLICMAVLWAAIAGQAETARPNPDPTQQDAVDRALHRMYNCDFAGAQAVITEQIRNHPDDPLLYAVNASIHLFSEFYRLRILETDFFADDEKVTDRKKLKPDPAVRAELFRLTGEARKLSAASLAVDANDARALFALYLASGMETDYTLLVEKKYFRSYKLSKESQQYARKLLLMKPPVYDAYISHGMLEYVVGNLNFFFRWFVHFDQIQGNKQLAIDYLKRVIEHGRYYAPYAKMLLSIIYLRENKPGQALILLQELAHDFPENPLIRKEIIRISAKINLN